MNLTNPKIQCFCGKFVQLGELHYPADNPENGPAHLPRPGSPPWDEQCVKSVDDDLLIHDHVHAALMHLQMVDEILTGRDTHPLHAPFEYGDDAIEAASLTLAAITLTSQLEDIFKRIEEARGEEYIPSPPELNQW